MGKLLVFLCYAICLCYADGVCFTISCVAYRISHYRRVGNFASCVIMGDNGQANVHCRFVDENDLSHLNIPRFILKLYRKFSGLDKNLEGKVFNYYGNHVWIEFRDLCELNHWIVHPDVLQRVVKG